MSNALLALAHRFRQAPKPFRYGVYVLSAYLVYVVALGLITPAVLQAKLPDMLTQQLGRTVALRQIRINPFLLRVRLDDFSIQEAHSDKTFTRFERLEVEINFWQSLLTLTPSVDHFSLTAPQLTLRRLGSGKFNFSDILTRLQTDTSTGSETSTTDTNTTLPAFRIGEVSMTQGQFYVNDDMTGGHLSYQGLNLNLSRFDSQAYSLTLPGNGNDNRTELASAANHYHLVIRVPTTVSLSFKVSSSSRRWR